MQFCSDLKYFYDYLFKDYFYKLKLAYFLMLLFYWLLVQHATV